MKSIRSKTFILLSLILISFGLVHASSNEIKLGRSSIELRMHGDVPDSLHIFLGWIGLLDFDDGIRSEFTKTDYGTYRVDLDTETNLTLGCLKIANQDDIAYALGIVEISGDETLVLDCTFTGSVLDVVAVTPSGFNQYPMDRDQNRAAYVNMKLFGELMFFGHGKEPMHGITDHEKVYAAGEDAWREVLRQSEEAYAPYLDNVILKDLFHEREREILQSQLAYYIYGSQFLLYDRRRSEWAPGGNRDIPPMEYYDFLNKIDYSYLTLPYVYYTPYIICRNIINYLPVGIEPIGDTPVSEWKRQAAEKLGLVMHEVPEILLNMLSASSYKMQLDDESRPFSATQIRNISEGYDDDLGKILLNYNRKLADALSGSLAVEDLTDRSEFDLRKYLDDRYPGKPVVVDFWNTWCSPCMQAHRDTEELRKLPEAEGVVFLFVSDTSSADKEFRRAAPGIGGEHVRLNQGVAYDFLQSEGLSGFPSYFFFDRDHRLIHKQTAFPGKEAYREMVRELMMDD